MKIAASYMGYCWMHNRRKCIARGVIFRNILLQGIRSLSSISFKSKVDCVRSNSVEKYLMKLFKKERSTQRNVLLQVH